MRGLIRQRMGTAVAVLAVTGLVATAGPAQAAATKVTGGSATTVSTPAVGRLMLRNGILPVPIGGAKLTRIGFAPVITTNTMPVVGGTVDPAAFFTGNVQSKGGLKFVRALCFCAVSISDFNIVISGDPHVDAKINGRGSIRLFDVDLKDLKLGGKGGAIEFNNTHLVLTDEGAAALNKGLHIKSFKKGLVFADSDTVIKYRQ